MQIFEGGLIKKDVPICLTRLFWIALSLENDFTFQLHIRCCAWINGRERAAISACAERLNHYHLRYIDGRLCI